MGEFAIERLLTSRWTLLTIIFFARTGVGFQFIAVAALMNPLRQDLQLGYGEVGFLLGAFMITAIILSIPNSIISTFLGDRVTLFIGLGALVFGGLIFAESSDYFAALSGRLIGGIGAVFITVEYYIYNYPFRVIQMCPSLIRRSHDLQKVSANAPIYVI